MIHPSDYWDPLATFSHARKCLTVGTHLVEAYVALSFWSRTCTHILVDVEARTCRSRGAHVACTRTYSGQGARKKIWPRTYIRAGSRTPTHAYVWPGLVYMAGSERRNCIVVVFMGRQRNASCSSGGNGMRGSQPAWTEQPMETRPGVPQNGRNGLVFDRPRSKQDPNHQEGSGVPQNGGNGPPTVETGVLLIGRGVAYRKTPLHGVLFIPPSTGTPPPSTIHPALHQHHGVLFIQRQRHRSLFIHPP